MEEALKCVRCKNYAKDAMLSNCECGLLYCELCAKQTFDCNHCRQRLSFFHEDHGHHIYGFSVNVLARRMLGSIPI